VVGRDAFVGRFGGQQHAGDTGAGVCPGSNQVKVPHVFAPVVGAEPACLRQAWFEREGGAVCGLEFGLEVMRRKRVHDVQMPPKSFETPALERGKNAIGEHRTLFSPING
jgi:hypothetical protein